MRLRSNCKAFTLIELLVVLAITGTIGAMVAPNLWKSYQRSNERFILTEFAGKMHELRRDLHLEGGSLLLPADKLTEGAMGDDFPSLPEGWIVTGNTAIYFLPTGVTNGGTIELEAPSGREWLLALQPLDGKLKVETR